MALHCVEFVHQHQRHRQNEKSDMQIIRHRG